MAEDNSEEPDRSGKELDLESADQEQEAEGSGKSRKKLILIGLAALLLIGGGAGAYLFLFSADDAMEMAEEMEEPPIEQAVYLELEPPFVVSLPDRGRQRFLQASITVRSRNHEAILRLEEHMPAIRHSLSNVLSAQTVGSIQTQGGIEQVRNEATDQINKILSEELQGEAIEDVLFTGFVMQ